MSGPALIAHLLLECLPGQPVRRVPENTAIMRDARQNAAFEEAGRDEGILAAVYTYHALQIAPLLQPGDRVLDLACGPGNLLAQVAGLRPDAHFTGIDASPAMLERAAATLARQTCDNVLLTEADMTRLTGVADASADAVLCTFSLHHLTGAAALQAALHTLRRVLKPGGRLYLTDFGRLKHRRTQRFLSHDRQADQSEAFTCDFFHSLRAAFSADELQRALQTAGLPAQCHRTALADFMLIFRSPGQHPVDSALLQRMKHRLSRLGPQQQRDFRNLSRWFTLGGLRLPDGLS